MKYVFCIISAEGGEKKNGSCLLTGKRLGLERRLDNVVVQPSLSSSNTHHLAATFLTLAVRPTHPRSPAPKDLVVMFKMEISSFQMLLTSAG